jgi:hypothetical protein
MGFRGLSVDLLQLADGELDAFAFSSEIAAPTDVDGLDLVSVQVSVRVLRPTGQLEGVQRDLGRLQAGGREGTTGGRQVLGTASFHQNEQ